MSVPYIFATTLPFWFVYVVSRFVISIGPRLPLVSSKPAIFVRAVIVSPAQIDVAVGRVGEVLVVGAAVQDALVRHGEAAAAHLAGRARAAAARLEDRRAQEAGRRDDAPVAARLRGRFVVEDRRRCGRPSARTCGSSSSRPPSRRRPLDADGGAHLVGDHGFGGGHVTPRCGRGRGACKASRARQGDSFTIIRPGRFTVNEGGVGAPRLPAAGGRPGAQTASVASSMADQMHIQLR